MVDRTLAFLVVLGLVATLAACDSVESVEVERYNPLDPKSPAYEPAPPGSLSADYRDGVVHLAWRDANLGEDAYLVERAVGDGPFHELARLDADRSAYVDRDLDAFRLRYRVSALAERGATTRLAADSVEVDVHVTGAQADVVHERLLRVRWDEVPFATGYRLSIGDAYTAYHDPDYSPDSTVAEVPAGTTQIDDTMFVCGDTGGYWTYMLQARAGGRLSRPVPMIMECAVPRPILRAEVRGGDRMRLSWWFEEAGRYHPHEDSSFVAGFEVVRMDDHYDMRYGGPHTDYGIPMDVVARLPATARSHTIALPEAPASGHHVYWVRTASHVWSNAVEASRRSGLVPVDTLDVTFRHPVYEIALDDAARRLAVVEHEPDDTDRLAVLDAASGAPYWSRDARGEVRQIAFDAPSGTLVALVDGDVVRYDAASGTPVDAFRTEDRLTSFSIAADARMLAASSWDGPASHLWNLDSGEHTRFGRTEPPDDTTAFVPARHARVALSPSAALVAAVRGGTVKIYEQPSGALVTSGPTCCYDVSLAGRGAYHTLAWLDEDRIIRHSARAHGDEFELALGSFEAIAFEDDVFPGGNAQRFGDSLFVTGPHSARSPQPLRVTSYWSPASSFIGPHTIAGDFAAARDGSFIVTVGRDGGPHQRWEVRTVWHAETVPE